MIRQLNDEERDALKTYDPACLVAAALDAENCQYSNLREFTVRHRATFAGVLAARHAERQAVRA